MHMWKKLLLAFVLGCVVTLAVTGMALYYIIYETYEPFDVVEAHVETKDLTGDSLKATADTFNADKSKDTLIICTKALNLICPLRTNTARSRLPLRFTT